MVETNNQRDERRLGMVLVAAVQVAILTPILMVLLTAIMWFTHGRLDIEFLLVAAAMIVLGLALGKVLELRKQW